MLGLNQIYVGDNLDLLKLVDNDSINLHLFSPPYAKMRKYDNFDGIEPDEYVDWIMPRLLEVERTLSKDGNFLLNINDCVVDSFRHPFVYDLISEIHKKTNLKLKERLFWNKGKFLPHPKRFGDKIEYLFLFTKSKDNYFNIDAMRVKYSDVSIKRMLNPIKKRFSRTEENQKECEYKAWKPNELGALPSTLISIGSESHRKSETHTAIYPEKLVEYFINGLSKPGGTVADIFSGSGTTALVAKRLGRNYIGIELSEKYATESRIRISKG